ncbi:MAG: LysR family transcriptional regulator [Xanthobacteraceae bacterium]
MTNIPTELLRTLLAVVDVRSFTKAARLLGVTQPAVSAQIKRLQSLLEFELFDKSAPGVSVTEKGERVVREARRLLAINDEIVAIAQAPEGARTLRLGLPGDFVGKALWKSLALFHARRPDWYLHLKTGNGPSLLNDMHQGDLDVVVALSSDKPQQAAAHQWRDEMVWIGTAPIPRPPQPVRLLSRGNDCIHHRSMTAALQSIGRSHEIAISFGHMDDISGAAVAGLGFTALPRGAALAAGAPICQDSMLPKLADVVVSICTRAESAPAARDELAALISEALRPAVTQAPLGARPSKIENIEAVAQRAPAA